MQVLDTNKRAAHVALFERRMLELVVGQDEAVRQITELFQLFKAKLNAPSRPIGNFLFLGPTGTGKTRVVEAMAESLYGDARAAIKIDCAEFQHSHEIAKLIGSPPGYLGHRETHPMLTQEALNQWHTDDCKITIVLFDEIEKASDALWQLLLGIMDKATLTLGDNRRVDFSNCVIVMTSNLGAAEMQTEIAGRIGFSTPRTVDQTKLESISLAAARRKFTPEFMNRLDKVVVFRSLNAEDLRRILDIELKMVQKRILGALHNFVVTCSPAFRAMLLKEGTDPQYGARHLKRAIEKRLVFALANLWSSAQIDTFDHVVADYVADKDEVTFTREPNAALAAFGK